MSFMIIPVICLMVGFGLAIRPAIQHDNDQPITVWKDPK
jgi:hypothetical protein